MFFINSNGKITTHCVKYISLIGTELQIQSTAKVSSCNHITCVCVNITQRCSHCSWLEVSMCNCHSSVMLALYCVNIEIKMQAARMKYTKDERIFLLISYLCNHADYTMILAEFAKHFPNEPITCHWNVTILLCKFKATGSVADVP